METGYYIIFNPYSLVSTYVGVGVGGCALTFKLKDKVCCTGQLFFSRPLCESLGYTAATEIQGVGDHHHSYPHG